MKNQVVGIDISKDTLDFCVLNVDTVRVATRGVVNNQKPAIGKWLKKWNAQEVIFALEHTGHYGAALVNSLAENNFTFYLINPMELKKSLGIHRGKTDAKDAYRIAEYAMANKHKIKPYQLPAKSIEKLRALLAARERYVKVSVQIQNSLKAHEILSQSVDVKMIIKEDKKQYRAIEKSIKNIEVEMHKIIHQNLQLKTTYQKITKVIGVGQVIAIKCIVETQNFTKFNSARKFSCHCGLAPFPYQSGSSIRGRTKTHYLRDKSLKAVLIKGAITAIQHDPQLKNYYQRKIKEGKHHMGVKNAVANKLVLRIFAVAKREEPFIKLTA